MAQLARVKVFSKLNANSGFWQILLSPQSAKLTTFITPYGRYCFYRLPLATPEHFQCCMSDIFSGQEEVVCMMDDIFIRGKTQEEHDQYLQRVIQLLFKSGLTSNREKCLFRMNQVTF